MDIKYLLKFGEREKISGIQTGKVWMSTPEALRPLEYELVKGQGDKLEGGMHIYSSKMQLTDPTTGFTVTQTGDFNFDILMNPFNNVPIYCMFAVYDSEVASGEIKLALETQTIIREHFPKADSVAVIKKPHDFIREFEESIHDDNENSVIPCISGKINYFNMYGIGDKHAIDGRFIDFITNGREPKRIDNKKQIPIYVDDAWRYLFCKDVFFQGEQEYRFILPDVSVDKGRLFEVNLSENIRIYGLDEFFERMNVHQ